MEAFGITDSSLEYVKEDDLGYIDIHNVRSSYSEGKRICECLCSSYAREYNVPVKIARLAQTFGAGIPYEENRVFAQFAKSAINGNDIVLHTAGQSVGNYCYTRDVVKAILLLLIRGNNGEAYTVANPASSITIRGMAEMVAKELADDKIKVILIYLRMRLHMDMLRMLRCILIQISFRNSDGNRKSDLSICIRE